MGGAVGKATKSDSGEHYRKGTSRGRVASGSEDESTMLVGGDPVKQKVSVHHVVHKIFYQAPVKVTSVNAFKKDKSFKGSEKEKEREKVIWIELDERALDQQVGLERGPGGGTLGLLSVDSAWEKQKQSFPVGVRVDKVGNISIIPKAKMKEVCISGDDVMASFVEPAKPSPPRLSTSVKMGAERITLEWDFVLGLVDFFQLEYRVAFHGVDPIPWTCSHCTVVNGHEEANCSVCEQERSQVQLDPPPLDPRYRVSREWEKLRQSMGGVLYQTVDGIQCGVPYLFRVRAHNEVGWGPFSETSVSVQTIPEPPETPDTPFHATNMLRPTRVLLQWKPNSCNGLPITEFQLWGGAVKDEKVELKYSGVDNFYILKDLEPEQMYIYKVHAANEKGPSAFSEYVTFVTPPAPVPEVEEEKRAELARALDDATDEAERDRLRREAYVCDWAQVSNPALGKRVLYVNIESEKSTTERPAAMDGPIDAVVEFKKKRFRFNRVVLQDVPKGLQNIRRLQIDRTRLLWDSFEQLMGIDSDAAELKKRLKVEYRGEEGIDSGGIAKDWFLEISRRLFQPRSNLFQKVEGEERYDVHPQPAVPWFEPPPPPPLPQGGRRFSQQPQPPQAHASVRDWYRFVGRFLGKAIYDRQLVDVHLSRTLFKQLFQLPIDMDDMRISDPTFVKSMEWMLENPIDGVIFEEFCVLIDPPEGASGPGSPVSPASPVSPSSPQSSLGGKIVVDLVPGGRNIEVTDENKAKYVELMLHWRAVGSCKQQIEAIREGLFELVDEAALQSAGFELEELEMLWNGLPCIDVQGLRNTAVYKGGWDTNHQVALWFWKIFKAMEQDDKALLLRFATGTSKVPVEGLDPPLNLTINTQLEPGSLIKAHSCFNQLVFPDFGTEDIMREKILFAIRNTDAFLLS